MTEERICRKCGLPKTIDCFPTVFVNNRVYQRLACDKCRRATEVARNRQRRANDPHFEMFSAARRRAKRRGTVFSLTRDDVPIPLVCPILGIPLVRKKGKGPSPNSPSLDEIVPGRGYVRGNAQVISNRANTMKNCGTLEELVRIGKWAKYVLDKLPII